MRTGGVLGPFGTVVLFAGVAAVGLSGGAVAQQIPAPLDGVTAEVRNAAGEVVLRGTFALEADSDDDGEDDDIEWEARLTGPNPAMGGSAEVEVPRAGGTGSQEVEFSIHGAEQGASYVFVIDGREIGTATADRRGRAKLERETAVTGQ